MQRITVNKYFYSVSFQRSSVVDYISNCVSRYMEKAIIIKFHIALKKNDRKVKSKI